MENTTYDISLELKTEMQRLDLYPMYSTGDLLLNSQNVQFVLVYEINNNHFRTISSDFKFSIVDISNTDLIRSWSYTELLNWFVSKIPYEDFTISSIDDNMKLSFKVDGIEYTSTNQSLLQSLSETIIQYLKQKQQ